MFNTFDIYFRHVLEYEGTGYEDVKGDNGGPTKCGITIADVARFNNVRCPERGGPGWDALVEKVKAVDPTTAGIIYKRFYWDDLQCDKLPGGLDYIVADYGVNSGSSKSARTLNGLLGVPGSVVTDQTISAAQAYADLPELITHFQDARKAFLIEISDANNPHYAHNAKFRRGWLEREAEVRTEGLSLAKRMQPTSVPIVAEKAPRPIPTPDPAPPSVVKEAGKSKSGWAILLAIGTYLTNWVQGAVDGLADFLGHDLPAIKSDTDGLVSPVTDTFSLLHINAPGISMAIIVACLTVAYVRHVRDKHRLAVAQQAAK